MGFSFSRTLRKGGLNLPTSEGDYFRQLISGGASLIPGLGKMPEEFLKGKGGGGFSASDMRARIAREQWEDYKQRFIPLEDYLAGIAEKPGQYAAGQRETATGLVRGAYERAPGQIERRLGSYGVQMTPEQQSRMQSRLQHSQTLAEVQAANQSQRLSDEQIMGAISGGTLSGARGLFTENQATVQGGR